MPRRRRIAACAGILIGLMWNPGARARHVLDAFVVNTLDGSVSVVNPHDMQETRRFPVGKRPYGIAVSAENGTMIIGVEGENKVKFFNATSFELMSAVPVEGLAQCGIVLTPDEKHVLIAHPPSGDLIGIAVETRKEAFPDQGRRRGGVRPLRSVEGERLRDDPPVVRSGRGRSRGAEARAEDSAERLSDRRRLRPG